MRTEIDGIIITLPNFGEERGLADALRLANLRVPVLIQATPDSCGQDVDRVSARQLLRQDVDLQQPEAVWDSLLADDAAYGGAGLGGVQGGPGSGLRRCAGWCRGSRTCGLGAIGARPTAFNTVRYSEKLLEKSGITVETLDL